MKWIPAHKQFHFNDNNFLECLREEDTETQSRISRGERVLGKGQDESLMSTWAEEKETEGHVTYICPL